MDIDPNALTKVVSDLLGNIMSTEQLAALLHLKPQSIRKRYCETGTYYSLRPVKLANGRLIWPADAMSSLTKGAAK